MALTAAERLKVTMSSIFRRKGGDGSFARLFDKLDASQRSILLGEFRPHQSELPVFGSVQDSSNWLILTTERLAWAIDGERREVAVNVVRDATADFRKMQRTHQTKLEIRELQVVTMDYHEFLIELEPGLPLTGTWNVLKFLGRRNRSRFKSAT